MEKINRLFCLRLLVGLPAALCALNGLGRPMETSGACPLGATLTVADPRADAAPTRIFADPRLMAEIRRRSAELPRWFASDEPSKSTLRLHRTVNNDILVLTRCNKANCDAERAYIGFDPRSGGWGASIYLSGRVLELGLPVMPGAALEAMPEDVAPAVICAQNLDWGN